jgi:hypothetical protein
MLAAAQPITAGSKSAQAFFDCLLPFDVGNDVSATLTFPKGKKKRLLVVDVTSRSIPAAEPTCEFSITLDVNGDNSLVYGGSITGNQGFAGTGLAHFWSDVDAQELAAPGQFYGQPIDLTVTVHRSAGSCTGACVGIDAHMMKK